MNRTCQAVRLHPRIAAGLHTLSRQTDLRVLSPQRTISGAHNMPLCRAKAQTRTPIQPPPKYSWTVQPEASDLAGGLNAFFVVVIGVDGLIATLGIGTLATGIAYWLSNYVIVSGVDQRLITAVSQNVFGVPQPVSSPDAPRSTSPVRVAGGGR
jgi:hypothetical protein